LTRARSEPNFDVFINCPFDEQFRACFEALLFAVTACGYRPRCALEETNSGDIRFTRLCRLIKECERSVHDLSRTEIGENNLPRFNMPFELGLLIGAKQFGGPAQRRKSALIMVRTQYVMPAYLSDLAGNDPVPHGGDPAEVIKLARRYLFSSGDPAIPGAARLIALYEKFRADLPALAEGAGYEVAELNALEEYGTYALFLEAFLKKARIEGLLV
jgi:hypothetical protein